MSNIEIQYLKVLYVNMYYSIYYRQKYKQIWIFLLVRFANTRDQETEIFQAH